MKRTVISYMFTLVVIICCFSAVYSIRYDQLKQELIGQKDSQGSDAPSQVHTSSKESPSEGDAIIEEESLAERDETTRVTEERYTQEVDVKEPLRTNRSMVYVVGRYDRATGEVTETVEKFPEELLDLTRQELLIFLRANPEYGSLLSFSEHAVYLRKSNDEDRSTYLYFLTLEEGMLMVYRLEDDSLYLDTGISEGELSKENVELLDEGIYIRDNAALFDYLQTVTS